MSKIDAARYAETMGKMLIGAEYGLNKNSTDADFLRAAEQIVGDAKTQQGVDLTNTTGLAKALKCARDDRRSW